MNFTSGVEGVCPPRDERCCPDEIEECSLEELRSAGECEMASELDYEVKKGRCTNDPKHCGGCFLTGHGKKREEGFRCLEAECKSFCAEDCQNGGTCSAPCICTCATGWSGETCATPVCSPPCKSGEHCAVPNICCPLNWTGADCKTPDRVRIPATGAMTTFVMGRPGSAPWDNIERPSHNVTLNAYMMDRYLVTSASYKL
ncbi:MAG: hypothetical protein WC966_01035 [Bradymonadales bacterium]